MDTQTLPHRCFTSQIHTEPCPKCQQTDQVFVGHGSVRTCMRCIISWAEDEFPLVLEMKEQTVTQKVRTLPKKIRQQINAAARSLAAASGQTDRLRSLRRITDEEWDAAQERDDQNTDQEDLLT